MLSKPHDDLMDGEEWRAFLRENSFGQVIAPGRGRDMPVVTPLHFALGRDDAAVFHLQRANPLLAALRDNPACLLAVIGSYVYIPSEWNAAPEDETRWGVPTSYYAAVQASCTAEIVDDAEGIAYILNQLMKRYEPGGSGHERVEPGDSPYGKLLGAITGVRLNVTRVTGKFKFGGNRDSAHRLRVAARLAKRNGPLDASARAHLLRRDEARRPSDAAGGE
ncbi:MAG: FMN-binding negative transcriptional regulator [Acidobacteria bacterium]|nr:FMN-binding negative transcriptional regulator [Acidobacteriota bacterium]